MQLTRPARLGVVAGLASLAAVLTAVASRSGIGMTWDSVAYAYAAREVAAGSTPHTMTGYPFTQYPPGVPAILGTAARALPGGLDVATIAAVLGIVLVAALVAITYALSVAALGDRDVALVPTALVAVATSTTMLYSRLWSEPLACVITALVLLMLTRAIVRARLTWPAVVAVVLLVSIAPWIRYAGAMLVAVAALGAALALRRHGWARAAAGGLLVGVASSVGTAAVIWHNLTLGSGPFGARTAPAGTLTGYVVDTMTTLGALVVPVPVADRLPAVTFATGLVVAALLAYGTVRVVRRRDAAMALVIAFVAMYWLFIGASGRIAFVEFMRYRIAAPALVPIAILAVYAGRDLLARTRTTRPMLHGLVRAVLAVLAVLSGPVALAQSAAYAATVGAHGHGYADVAVTRSPLAAAVAGLPRDAVIVSNDPLAVYWATGRVVSRYGRPPAPAPAAGTYVADFDSDIAGTTRAPIDPPADGAAVTVVAELPDGRLYLVG